MINYSCEYFSPRAALDGGKAHRGRFRRAKLWSWLAERPCRSRGGVNTLMWILLTSGSVSRWQSTGFNPLVDSNVWNCDCDWPRARVMSVSVHVPMVCILGVNRSTGHTHTDREPRVNPCPSMCRWCVYFRLGLTRTWCEQINRSHTHRPG